MDMFLRFTFRSCTNKLRVVKATIVGWKQKRVPRAIK